MRSLYIRILALAGIISLACTTKVSEWVLLNAPPNTYTLVYFRGSQPDEKAKSAYKALTSELASANIRFREAEVNAARPYYALYYEAGLVSKYNQQSELRDLISSPLRDKIADEIMKGKLCVMLYLKTGNIEKDQKGLAELRRAVEASPFSAIIPVIELNRNDATEKHLISMLLNVEDDLKDLNEPMLFGIFGRFKALEPLVAGGIRGENISLMIDFLTSDCSCLIKDNLPGRDILYVNKWDSPATALVNEILDRNPLLQHK